MSAFLAMLPSPGATVDSEELARLTGAMRYRGPDGSGQWTDGTVGLGHALLQTAPEPERQPLSLDGDVWIVAEARLDARDDLARALRAEGPVPIEAPDAELVLRAYLAWGEAGLDRLRGDFSFAIWDGRRGRLVCARDPLGRGTLYIAETAEGVVLSNTLNVLRLHSGVSGALNPRAIGDYLLVGHNRDLETTFFAGIQQVPPAHALTWEAGRLQHRRYWSVPEPGAFALLTPDACTEEFRDLLKRAVADRTRTDRVFLTLSGGLDSTAVAVAAKEASHEGLTSASLEAITFGFDWLVPDEECHYAGLVTRELALDGACLRAEDFLTVDAIDDAWSLPAEPCFSLRTVPLARFFDRLEGGRGYVALSGFGGDPLLAPRGSYDVDRLGRAGLGNLMRLTRHHLRVYGRPAFGLKSYLRRRAAPPGGHPELVLPLDPAFAAEWDLDERWRQVTADLGAADSPTGMATDPFWITMRMASQPGFAGALTELRHPFFDTRLLEFVLRLPPKPWLRRKHLVREAMRGRLPEAVRTRRKKALGGHMLHELAVRGLEVGLDELTAVPELGAFVDRDAVRSMALHPAGTSPGQYQASVVMPASLGHWLSNRDRILDEPRRASQGPPVPVVAPQGAPTS